LHASMYSGSIFTCRRFHVVPTAWPSQSSMNGFSKKGRMRSRHAHPSSDTQSTSNRADQISSVISNQI
jgi:hypothetical protein